MVWPFLLYISFHMSEKVKFFAENYELEIELHFIMLKYVCSIKAMFC